METIIDAQLLHAAPRPNGKSLLIGILPLRFRLEYIEKQTILAIAVDLAVSELPVVERPLRDLQMFVPDAGLGAGSALGPRVLLLLAPHGNRVFKTAGASVADAQKFLTVFSLVSDKLPASHIHLAALDSVLISF
ncbi:MAG: hypothetical protein IJQ02_02890, partial [Oscillospiraceae bacterium]|nr:hypothetical protein [Oscillospiraceae bacterium]